MRDNLLLENLPKAERERLNPYLHRVELEAEQLLIKEEKPITHIAHCDRQRPAGTPHPGMRAVSRFKDKSGFLRLRRYASITSRPG